MPDGGARKTPAQTGASTRWCRVSDRTDHMERKRRRYRRSAAFAGLSGIRLAKLQPERGMESANFPAQLDARFSVSKLARARGGGMGGMSGGDVEHGKGDRGHLARSARVLSAIGAAR